MIIHENVKSENIIEEIIGFVTQATFKFMILKNSIPNRIEGPPSRDEGYCWKVEKYDEGG